MPVAPQLNPTPEVGPPRLGKTFSASIAVLVAGLTVLLLATGGGQSFTTETLRRQQVTQQPQPIGAFNITTRSGEKTTLTALLANDKGSGNCIPYFNCLSHVNFSICRCKILLHPVRHGFIRCMFK